MRPSAAPEGSSTRSPPRDLEGFVDRPVDGLARLDLDLDLDRRRLDQPFDPDAEAASGAVDEALRLFWSEGPTRDGLAPGTSTPRPESAPDLDRIDVPADEVRLEAVRADLDDPSLASTRLILKVSPPSPLGVPEEAGPRAFREPGARSSGRQSARDPYNLSKGPAVASTPGGEAFAVGRMRGRASGESP